MAKFHIICDKKFALNNLKYLNIFKKYYPLCSAEYLKGIEREFQIQKQNQTAETEFLYGNSNLCQLCLNLFKEFNVKILSKRDNFEQGFNLIN